MAQMTAPATGVKVRMYRVKYTGDCFLLAFPGTDGEPRYMLVDCGVYQLTRGSAAHMRRLARDIKKATGGHLHVVVATHEHWDHLSGFQFAKAVFDEIQIDDVWLAWTEDPDDTMAVRLRRQRLAMVGLLRDAAARLAATNDPLAADVDSLLGFTGPAITSTADQMDYIAHRVPNPTFCSPGDRPLTIKGVDQVRVWVLVGPPRDERMLSRSNPRRGETYGEHGLTLNPEIAAFRAAITGDQEDAGQPFDEHYRISHDEVRREGELGRFFRERYGFGDQDSGPSWRRIETDWMLRAGQLAIDLDEDTNNTSLALAFELTPGGPVLLFPGDAQVGNWLSWLDLEWSSHITGGEPLRTADLLNRTVLYKVGHHGSHNATLKDRGLELMTDPGLTALLPVEEEHARERSWAMPFPPLLKRLEEMTRGKVVRADEVEDGPWVEVEVG